MVLLSHTKEQSNKLCCLVKNTRTPNGSSTKPPDWVFFYESQTIETFIIYDCRYISGHDVGSETARLANNCCSQSANHLPSLIASHLIKMSCRNYIRPCSPCPPQQCLRSLSGNFFKHDLVHDTLVVVLVCLYIYFIHLNVIDSN